MPTSFMLVDIIVKVRPDPDTNKELGTVPMKVCVIYIIDDEICDTSIVLDEQ